MRVLCNLRKTFICIQAVHDLKKTRLKERTNIIYPHTKYLYESWDIFCVFLGLQNNYSKIIQIISATIANFLGLEKVSIRVTKYPYNFTCLILFVAFTCKIKSTNGNQINGTYPMMHLWNVVMTTPNKFNCTISRSALNHNSNINFTVQKTLKCSHTSIKIKTESTTLRL